MSVYAGAEQAMVTQWVMEQLTSKATDLDAISSGLSLRIYEDFAPTEASYPLIIVQCQVPPRDVRGVGVSRVMVDTLFIVKAVAQVTSYGPLAPIAGVIDNAMTSSVGSPVADGAVFTSIRDEQFALVEVDAGVQYRHFGGQYKIQAQA